ncbi:hypothetical protein S2091_3050 [Solimicrobium silvestre]|uniref:Uncharacterized protein n=2 Tax=Solimicrobium silvestre TaxID=2099400 RepID=A0A2S9GWP1_9BURK|nr:hypothetical protein S2091_3050 [Solimicrobium silvestre]
MKLIATKQGKTEKYDVLRCVRKNGTETSTKMPRQGQLPHDLIHYVVETALGYEHGFLGLIAKGADLAFAMEQTHDIQNQQIADQATHAEALVESLQAQMWSGMFDNEQFLAGLEGACSMRNRAVPDLSKINPERDLYEVVLALAQRWLQVPFYASLELDMQNI